MRELDISARQQPHNLYCLSVSTKMTWLKTSWKALITALGVAFVLFLAAMQKSNARKWQQTSVDIEKGNVKKGTMTAEAASTKAKFHDAKADEIVAKAVKRTGEKDEATADILARWGT